MGIESVLHRPNVTKPVPADTRSKGAIFVDFENVQREIQNKRLVSGSGPSAGDVAITLLQRLRLKLDEQGQIRILIGRAYADWSPPLGDSLNSLALLSIVPRHVVAKPQKNSADLELSLEVLETMLTRSDIDHFIIVSGDRDYIPIVRRLQENGKLVTIAAFEASVAGDLKALVGKDGFVSLDLLDGSVDHGGVPISRSTMLVPTAIAAHEPRPASVAPSQETESQESYAMRTLDLVLKATKGTTPREVGLQYFYVNYMNDALSTLTNEQRKDIIRGMQAEGLIAVERKGDWYHPYVVVVNEEHPLVKARLSLLSEEQEPTLPPGQLL